MSRSRAPAEKIVSIPAITRLRADWKNRGLAVVFTNGCFDLLHSGHLETLRKARTEGDLLIVAINSDKSTRGLKGPGRPLVPEAERAEVLASFGFVDYVVVFDEPDPGALIAGLLPEVLVKGGDWGENAIVGRETVETSGGRVVRVPPVAGRSTTGIVERVLGTGASER